MRGTLKSDLFFFQDKFDDFQSSVFRNAKDLCLSVRIPHVKIECFELI